MSKVPGASAALHQLHKLEIKLMMTEFCPYWLMKGQYLKAVDSFLHLGSTLSCLSAIIVEVIIGSPKPVLSLADSTISIWAPITQFCRFNGKTRSLPWKSRGVLASPASTHSCRRHVIWMPVSHLPKQLLYDELHQDTCTSQRQKEWFKDCLKATFKDFSTDTTSWEAIALDHPT